MNIIYHYPPELFGLLVDTIPLLCRSKKDTVIFFKGAGVSNQLTEDIEKRVVFDRNSINKYEITRTILTRLNEQGEATLRERRELLKRICEFESFSNCWPDDQLKAKGLVTEIQRIVNIKDSFTRMKDEHDKEKRKHKIDHQQKIKSVIKKRKALEEIKNDLFSLFGYDDKHKRGKLLEGILNRLFEEYGILIRESFGLVKEEGGGVTEQVDGVVEIDGELYLVEMKWTKDPIGVDPVSRHLVRVYHRRYSRAIFISASPYTKPAIEVCKEALQQTVIVLCSLEEIVRLIEQEENLKSLLKEKINAAIIDKNPFKTAL